MTTRGRQRKWGEAIANAEAEVVDLERLPETAPLRRQLLPQCVEYAALLRREMKAQGKRKTDVFFLPANPSN